MPSGSVSNLSLLVMRREQTDNSRIKNVVPDEGSAIAVEKTTSSVRLMKGF